MEPVSRRDAENDGVGIGVSIPIPIPKALGGQPVDVFLLPRRRASTSKKGVSALEIHRQTGVSYKSSLFMLNRIRYAMSDSAPAPLGPTGEAISVAQAIHENAGTQCDRT